MHIKSFLLIPSAALLLASCASAQVTYRGHGYGSWGFESPSGASLGDTMSAGFGGDYFIWKGVGFGADGTYAFPRRQISKGIGLASVHGSYHWVNQYNPRRFAPFVNAGYTLGFRESTANFAHLGAGAIYWFKPALGARFEWRNTFTSNQRFLSGIRLGIAFRR